MPPNLKRPRPDDEVSLPPKRAVRKPVAKQGYQYHTIDSFSDLVLKVVRKNEFKHTPLTSDAQSDKIRILVLQPGEPEAMISCTLVVYSLSDANEKYYYEALSYYWGTDAANCEIKIHELTEDKPRTIKNIVDRAIPRKFYIRSNLHAALSRLRDKDRSINLWVDALCIDQDDEREKNQQVSIMSKIYSGAHRVCIWLGAGNSKCQQAMDFIEEIIDLSSLDTLIQDESTVTKWDALVELMRCRWFSRRWVIQELAFATDATLHYDGKSVHWTEFADAIALFVTKFDNIKNLFRSSRRFNHNPEHLGDIIGLGANNLVNVASNLFRRSNHDQGQEIERLSGLEALVSSLLSFEASDPRDTVYALLSIAKNDNSYRNVSTLSRPNNNITPLAPDYNKTIEEVYRNFTQFCIETSRSIDIICRHWAPFRRKASATTEPIRIIGNKKRKEKRNVKMPSWVPSLDGSPFGNPESALNGRVHGDSLVGHPDRKNYNAAGGKEADVRFEEINSTMSPGKCILGCSISCIRAGIAKTKGSLENESSSLPPSPSVSEFASVGAFTNTATENNTPSVVFFLYVKGFQVDVVQKVSSRIAGGLLLRESLIMGGWDDPEDLNEVPEALWRTLVADRSPEGGNPPTWYHRACLNCFARSTSTGDIDTGALIANPRSSSIMTKFLRRVQSVVWNRQFLKSKTRDFFGLAPMGTEVGDIICILFGCSVPVILREHRSLVGEIEYYELIGEAYVYGLMDGEALHKILPSTKEVDFKLG